MTKADLARKIAEKTGIEMEVISEVLGVLGEAVVEGLKEDLALEPRLLIPGFGFFTLKKDKRAKAGYRLEFKSSAVFKGKLRAVA